MIEEERTTLFANLSGFTAPTEAHGDETAAGSRSAFSTWLDPKGPTMKTIVLAMFTAFLGAPIAAAAAEPREAFAAMFAEYEQIRLALVNDSYCAMKDKSWLQATGRVGNPYGGKAMVACGKVTDGGASGSPRR